MFQVLVILSICFIAIYLCSAQAAKRAREAELTAAALKLRFEAKLPIADNCGNTLEALQKPGTAGTPQELPAIVKAIIPIQWTIVGEYQDFPVIIREITRGSGKNKRRLLRFEVCFRKVLPFRLALSREGIFEKFGKVLGMLQEIQTGRAQFDSLVLIKGDPEQSARMWLSNTVRQNAIEQLLNRLPSAQLDERGLSLEESSYKLTPEFCGPILTQLCSALRALA